MNVEEVRSHITHWVMSTLSVPSALFNGLPPCPYSREAWLRGRVDVRLVHSGDFVEALLDVGRTWDDVYALVLLAADPDRAEPQGLARRMAEANEMFEADDLIAFFDHPACTDPACKVTSGNGRYLLGGVQRLSAFVEAAAPLHKRRYFERVNKQFDAAKHLGAVAKPIART